MAQVGKSRLLQVMRTDTDTVGPIGPNSAMADREWLQKILVSDGQDRVVASALLRELRFDLFLENRFNVE